MGIISSVRELQGSWPTYAAFARDVGVSEGAAQQWRLRKSIPPEHWSAVIRAATERGVKGVTIESLLNMRTNQGEAA